MKGCCANQEKATAERNGLFRFLNWIFLDWIFLDWIRRGNLYQGLFIGLVVTVGAAILASGLYGFTSENLPRFIAYTIIALASSGMKVRLPSIMGTISMNFVFLLIGVGQFSLGETLLLGCLATLAQCLLQAKIRPKGIQVLFSIASIEFSLRAAYSVHHLANVRSLIFTTAVFFVTNTFVIASVIALSEKKNALQVWKDSYFWTFPSYMAGAAAAWLMIQADRFAGWEAALLIIPVVYLVYRSHRLYIGRLEEEKTRAEQQRAHAEEVAALHRRTIETLALAIEAKDQTTHDHLQRVEVYAVEVGKELGLPEAEMEALRAAALLHDIGKIAVPEYIIAKPGKLTPEEFEKMKTHTVVGAELVERINFPYPVAPMVRGHHEKWNGTGYPDGLSQDQIPIGARILAAVDCLDALASDRQYRRALPLNEAIRIIESESGKSFDPEIVKILAQRHVQLESMAREACRIQKLSTDLKIEKGDAPAAGFEQVSRPEPVPDRGTSNAKAKLSEAIAKCPDRGALFALLRTSLRDVVPYDAMVVYLRDGNILIPQCLDGENYALFAALEVPLGEGLSGWVAEHGMAIINGNPSVEPGYLRDPSRFSTLGSALAVPLGAQDGIRGVLSLYLQGRDAFVAENLETLTALAGAVTHALEVSTPEPVHDVFAGAV